MSSKITEIIRQRKSIFPATYIDKPIDKAIIEEILENANHAPTHRYTEPWRFKVFQGEALKELSKYLGETYQKVMPPEKFSPKKFEKTKKKPLQCACIIAICMQRDPQASIPEWEEIAAVACAVQNMWLTCTAYDIGSYWSSPTALIESEGFLNLPEGQRCLGFFYMGYHDTPDLPRRRQPMSEKVEWFD